MNPSTIIFEKIDHWTSAAKKVISLDVKVENLIFADAMGEIRKEVEKNLILLSDKNQKIEYLKYVRDELQRAIAWLELRKDFLVLMNPINGEGESDGDEPEYEKIEIGWGINEVIIDFRVILNNIGKRIEELNPIIFDEQDNIEPRFQLNTTDFELKATNHRLILLYQLGMLEPLLETIYPKKGIGVVSKILATIMGVENINSFRGEVGKLQKEVAGIRNKSGIEKNGQDIYSNLVLNRHSITNVNKYLNTIGLDLIPVPLKKGEEP